MSYAELLSRFRGMKAVVIGDLMIDEYVFGSVSRISPEAPVMVVRHDRTTQLPGGAANVARNLQAFGAQVSVAGVVGAEDHGLEASLAEYGLEPLLVTDPDRVTTRKTRVLADDRHQLLRIDHEDERPIPSSLAGVLVERVSKAIAEADVVLLSDYRKGALTAELIRELHLLADQAGAFCAANAKPSTFEWYRGCDLTTLNRSEASAVLGEKFDVSEAVQVARQLQARVNPTAVAVTLGAKGMALAGSEQSFRLHAPRVEVSDPAGAGDTVLATAALACATEGFGPRAFEVAALAAACVVQHVGVATPTEEDLRLIGESEPGILFDHASS